MSSTSADNVVLAGDIMNWANGMVTNIENLAIGAAGMMAVVATVMAYVKTKSWAGTLTAAVLGAVVVFAVSHIDGLSNMVDSEVPQEKSVKTQPAIGTHQSLDQTVVVPADLL